MTDDTTDASDPYLWLEDVLGERALDWVREHDSRTLAALQGASGFDALRERIRAILDSKAQIPAVVRRGAYLWNFWQDAEHPRGLWRRTTLDEYRRADPAWQVLLDVDALGRDEGVNWVWQGATVCGPAYRRALLSLSRGGADAHEVREFDVEARCFVAGGFQLPEAKSAVAWLDEDTLLVASDFGPGTLTDSGYPRVARRWRRGEPLGAAKTVFEAERSDVAAAFVVDRTPGHERTLLVRAIDFYTSHSWLLRADDTLQRIAHPDDASIALWRERIVVALRSDWDDGRQRFARGSLLVADAQEWLDGRAAPEALFTPTATRSLLGWTATRETLVLTLLDDVAGRLEEWRRDAALGWQRREVQAPFPGTLSAQSLHDEFVADDALAEACLVSYADFLTPDTLTLARTGSDAREVLKSRPSFFDAAGLRAEQHFATSNDGTRVPYFVVRRERLRDDGRNPTLLYGYGGFEVPLLPSYSGSVGAAWLERGGVHVVANIRGGGEYGPAWHQAALKDKRQNAFDDFAAVAEDLVRRGITRPAHLGIMGGSNGGLLVGAAMLQRPELYGAVVCQVPLLDMKRYHRLLAGASWMAEYGDPDDPAQWAWIARWSPYQNVRPHPKLPPLLLITSTRDDRVHPGHARKMAARMQEQGHRVLYYENLEGGHAAAADNAQRALMAALEYTFLWRELAPD